MQMTHAAAYVFVNKYFTKSTETAVSLYKQNLSAWFERLYLKAKTKTLLNVIILIDARTLILKKPSEYNYVYSLEFDVKTS